MMPAPPTRSRASGVTLLEVLVMASVLGICAMALGQAMMGAMNQTRMADEMRAASFAAREKMEEVLARTKATVVADYANGGLIGNTFVVTLNNTPAITLQGPGGNPAGEVIIVSDENANPATLGRDLNGVGGGDGVTMSPLPMDLNGDGVVPSAGPALRLVVGVVVRWVSFAGTEQRYELWSVR